MATERSSISYAVILAGGRGERLRPLTDKLPKPMAPINGTPFLWYLADQLRRQGFSQITILAGYLGQQIESWAETAPFGNEVQIKVEVSPAEWDPLVRLKAYQSKLPRRFILLYGDNFISFRYDKMRLMHASHNKTVSLLASPKSPGNIEILPGRHEIQYLTKRSKNAAHVDLGFMSIETNSFFASTDSHETLTQALAHLSNNGEVIGLEHLDRYYSISDPERYAETTKLLVPKKILLLDRDGTLNNKPKAGTYLKNHEDFSLLPQAKSGLAKLCLAGFKFVIVTNQAGLATGDLSNRDLESIHAKMAGEFKEIGAELLGVYVCPAHWNDKTHPDRKPQAGLFYKLSRELLLRLDDAFYVGDDVRDMFAAWNANCLGAYIGETRELAALSPEQQPKIVGTSLENIAEKIISYYSAVTSSPT